MKCNNPGTNLRETRQEPRKEGERGKPTGMTIVELSGKVIDSYIEIIIRLV